MASLFTTLLDMILMTKRKAKFMSLFNLKQIFNCITLHYITLRYITLRYITLHYIMLRYIKLH